MAQSTPLILELLAAGFCVRVHPSVSTPRIPNGACLEALNPTTGERHIVHAADLTTAARHLAATLQIRAAA